MDLTQINEWWVLITGIITGIGGFLAWIKLRKYNEAKDISQSKKETKFNNVDGDTALVNQIDLLLIKITALSDVIIKIQTELSIMKDKELSYKSAFHRLTLLCDEVCKDAVFCKSKIQQILTDLKLN